MVGLDCSWLIPKVPLGPPGAAQEQEAGPVCPVRVRKTRRPAVSPEDVQCPPCAFSQGGRLIVVLHVHTRAHTRVHTPRMHTSPHSRTKTCALLTKTRPHDPLPQHTLTVLDTPVHTLWTSTGVTPMNPQPYPGTRGPSHPHTPCLRRLRAPVDPHKYSDTHTETGVPGTPLTRRGVHPHSLRRARVCSHIAGTPRNCLPQPLTDTQAASGSAHTNPGPCSDTAETLACGGPPQSLWESGGREGPLPAALGQCWMLQGLQPHWVPALPQGPSCPPEHAHPRAGERDRLLSTCCVWTLHPLIHVTPAKR